MTGYMFCSNVIWCTVVVPGGHLQVLFMLMSMIKMIIGNI